MQHTLQHHIINKLRKELVKRNLTQGQLGDKLNKSRQMVANYLTERTDLTINILEEICDVLSLNIENLINPIIKSEKTDMNQVNDKIETYEKTPEFQEKYMIIQDQLIESMKEIIRRQAEEIENFKKNNK